MQTSRATDRRTAFTLVELLASTAVLALLVTVLGGIFSQVSRTWIAGEGGVERRRSARAMTDFIAAELRGAAAPVDRVSTKGKNNLQLLINPPSGVLPDDCVNADSIFWQAPIATETTFGDLAEIGYFVRWDPNSTTSRQPTLCRFFVNPSTIVAGKPESNPLFLIYSKPQWLTADLVRKVAPATAPAFRGLFAENVAGLWVRAFQPDGAELFTEGKKTYDSRLGYRYKVANGTTQERFLPARVQVSIAQFDAAGAVQLDALGSKVRALVKKESVHDAGDFLAELQAATKDEPAMSRLLPGLRIHTTEVRLENSR